MSGFFFKAVVQVVLLFFAETWLVTPGMVRFLGEFQYQLMRHLMGWLPRKKPYGKWEYT